MSLPQLPGENIMRVATLFRGQNDPDKVFSNISFWHMPGGVNPSDAATVLSGIRGAYTDEWLPVCSDAFEMFAQTYKDLTSLGNPTYDVPDTPVPGSVGADFGPADALCVKHVTDGGGRNRRGRTYLVGCGVGQETGTDNQKWGDTAIAAASTWAEAMLAVNFGSIHWVVASSYDEPKIRNSSLTPYEITASAVTSANITTQRRRRLSHHGRS